MNNATRMLAVYNRYAENRDNSEATYSSTRDELLALATEPTSGTTPDTIEPGEQAVLDDLWSTFMNMRAFATRVEPPTPLGSRFAGSVGGGIALITNQSRPGLMENTELIVGNLSFRYYAEVMATDLMRLELFAGANMAWGHIRAGAHERGYISADVTGGLAAVLPVNEWLALRFSPALSLGMEHSAFVDPRGTEVGGGPHLAFSARVGLDLGPFTVFAQGTASLGTTLSDSGPASSLEASALSTLSATGGVELSF
jgi:hypothetical protein